MPKCFVPPPEEELALIDSACPVCYVVAALLTRTATITLKLDILYTNIGRGHPFYLDGLIESLIRMNDLRLIRDQRDVFDVSDDISNMAWQTARWLYLRGSSGGLVGKIYTRLRRDSDYNRQTLMMRIMARDIVRTYWHKVEPLVVAHPTLVGMLAGRQNLIYQHGELVVPDEALVNGASVVLVPTDEAAGRFRDAGYEMDQVVVSGVCIEPPLVAQAEPAYQSRLKRLRDDRVLTIAMYSSGAEPAPHVDVLVTALISVLQAGHQVVVFARQGGRFQNAVQAAARSSGFAINDVSSLSDLSGINSGAALAVFDSRQDEYELTARLFSSFDLLVSPPHERTNWAVGLGLPMLSVEPSIGPFAPLNQRLLLDRGVARMISLANAAGAGNFIEQLRGNGELQAMAQSGWRKIPIDGFETAARFLTEKYATAD